MWRDMPEYAIISTMFRRYRSTLLALILIVPPSVSFCQATNFTAETAASYLGLVPPIRVTFAGGYMDGGSIGFSLADSTTNVFHMFEDHNMSNSFVGKTNLPQRLRDIYEHGSNTAGRIYIAEDKPRRGGRLTSVEEGQKIKAAVECLALAWIDSEFNPETQKKFSDRIELRRKGDDRYIEVENELMPKRLPDEASYDYFVRRRPIHNAIFITATLKKKR
jgi:hypothetical protein